jgi:RNA polymerase sigma-70 factor (ECF subfamily)
MTEHEVKFKESTGLNFQEFYNDYKPKLRWHLASFTKDLQLAEDYTQEAFIQGLKKIDTFDPSKSQIQTWITTIGRNLVIKAHKESLRLPSVSMDKDLDEDNTSLITFLPYDDGKEEIVKEKEIHYKYGIVVESIEKLPPKYKEVMIMREIEKMPYKDIADKLERNLSTVKSQIRKGRQLIIDDVEKKFKYIDDNGVE